MPHGGQNHTPGQKEQLDEDKNELLGEDRHDLEPRQPGDVMACEKQRESR